MKYRVVSIGEVLWDIFPGGAEIGGAPGNFIYHVNALGADGIIISAVGDDSRGQEILSRFRGMGLNTQYISIDKEHPTGTVSVEVDKEGKPSYTIHENVAWDFIPHTTAQTRLVKNIDAVCFGSLCQRSPVSRGTIRWLVKNAPPGALKIFDINLRQSFYTWETLDYSLHAADILKLNEEELKIIAGFLTLEGSKTTLIKQIAKNYGIRLVAYTQGPEGSILVSGEEISDHPGYKTTVVDTIGAGDAFTAALIMGVLKDKKLNVINDVANRVASFVCSRRGATPALPDDLKTIIH